MNKSIQSVKIIEVGPRDGLQNEQTFVPTEIKINFINLLVEAGIKELEATSFVNPEKIPQLSDAEKVLKGIKKKKGVVYSALIPNMNGLKRALEVGIDRAVFFIAASETFNQKNLNSSIENTLKRFKEMSKICKDNGIPIKGSISTCFECPYEGKISPESVGKIVDALRDMEIDRITLCDTMGVVAPPEVEKLISFLEKNHDISIFALHIHDTKGCAIASVYKGFEMGIKKFEASAGGLGGCPNAPGASGNLATEEVVYLFERMGINTGVDINKLIEASEFIERALNKHLTSRVLCYERALNKIS